MYLQKKPIPNEKERYFSEMDAWNESAKVHSKENDLD